MSVEKSFLTPPQIEALKQEKVLFPGLSEALLEQLGGDVKQRNAVLESLDYALNLTGGTSESLCRIFNDERTSESEKTEILNMVSNMALPDYTSWEATQESRKRAKEQVEKIEGFIDMIIERIKELA